MHKTPQTENDKKKRKKNKKIKLKKFARGGENSQKHHTSITVKHEK